MIIDANSIRKGDILLYDNRLWTVLEREHVKPGKGGAFVQAVLKDIKNQTKTNKRFRSNENVEKARVDEIEYKYLYRQDDYLMLMNKINAEEIKEFDINLMSDEDKIFLQEEIILIVKYFDEICLSINLPEKITCEILETEPVVKGQTATGSYKPALIYNNIRIMVPPFIKVGEKIVIITEDKTYKERAKEE